MPPFPAATSPLSAMRPAPALLRQLAHRGPQPSLARRVSSLRTLSSCPHHGAARPRPAPSAAAHRTTAPRDSLLLPPRRRFSTSPQPRQDAHRPHITYFSPPPQPPPPPPPRRRRWFPAAFFFLLGGLGAVVVHAIVSPPTLPAAGSKRDLQQRERVRGRALKLPIVQDLLADPEWTHHEAYSSIPLDARANHLTAGSLSSATSIGAYQHIFHHRPARPPLTPFSSSPPDASPEVINVIYLGPGVSGFPTMVHGGALATVLDEHSARAALEEPSLRARGQGVLTARLDLQYRRPTAAGTFYVVRARALRDDELDPAERGKRDRKVWVDLLLETLDGKPCVTGRALFVIPRGQELRGVPEGF